MNNVAYLGIDVSKGYADFILLNPKKEIIEDGFQLDDNNKGHSKIKELLKTFCTNHQLEEIQCAVESTGGYENNWYNFFKGLNDELPVKVTRLNAKGVKSNREATLSKNITDELSSKYIAEYMISHPEKVSFNQESINNFDSLRRQYKYIKLLLKQSTQLSNQLEKLLYSAFPEILYFSKNGLPVWAIQLLTKYPTAERLSRATVKVVSKIKNITTQKAEKLIGKAKNSVGKVNDQYMVSLISSLAKELIHKKQIIAEQKKLFENNAKGESIELLESITGFGTYSSAALIIEIEDVSRFESAKKLVSYSGIHPEMKESGDKKRKVRMSKKGRAGIRDILYNVAKTAAVHDEHIKAIYLRLRKKGMSYYGAIGVIMHKMLRIAYGVLKNGEKYDAEIDKKNQEISEKENMSLEERKERHIKFSRRHQLLDSQAPISGRNWKKRKALLSSQSNDITENGIKKTVPVAKV